MKRNKLFAAISLSVLWKPSRLTYIVVALLLMLITSTSSANAQSKDRDNPTRLTSNEISGLIGYNIGDSYYYTFIAGPGEVTITLNVEAGRTAIFNFNVVDFELFNEAERRIALKGVTAYKGGTGQAVEQISFSRRQQVLLRISIGDQNSGSGKYRLRLSGAVDFSQDASAPRDKDDKRRDFPNILAENSEFKFVASPYYGTYSGSWTGTLLGAVNKEPRRLKLFITPGDFALAWLTDSDYMEPLKGFIAGRGGITLIFETENTTYTIKGTVTKTSDGHLKGTLTQYRGNKVISTIEIDLKAL